jgi:hypothetical protein
LAMADELQKEAIVACMRYCPGICLKGLRKRIKNICRGSLDVAEIQT